MSPSPSPSSAPSSVWVDERGAIPFASLDAIGMTVAVTIWEVTDWSASRVPLRPQASFYWFFG